MKNLPRTIAFLFVLIVIGVAIYQARQAANLREKNARLQMQQADWSSQVDQLQRELDAAKSRLAALMADQLKGAGNDVELLKLRAEITKLRPLQKNVDALQKMASQSVATGLGHWKLADAQNVGRATPQDAVQSFAWAVANTNVAEIEQNLIPPIPKLGLRLKFMTLSKINLEPEIRMSRKFGCYRNRFWRRAKFKWKYNSQRTKWAFPYRLIFKM